MIVELLVSEQQPVGNLEVLTYHTVAIWIANRVRENEILQALVIYYNSLVLGSTILVGSGRKFKANLK